MPIAADRIDFYPPKAKRDLRAIALALLIHLLLILALTWGVNWKNTDDAASFSAELWPSSNTPQPDAAPVQPSPVIPPPPEAPTPPTPTPPAPQVKETPPAPDVDIALEEEKKRKQLADKKLAQDKAARDKAKLLAQQAEEEKAEKLKAAKLAKADKAKEDAKKAQQAKELQAAADAKDASKQKQVQAAAQAAEKQRQENMKRIAGLAASTTGDTDGSSSNKATAGGKGASLTYGSIVRAAIKPNVVFTEEIVGNPLAKVEVKLMSDGTIISQKLVQSSGNKSWDDAAINAIVRTRVIPKDVDGRIPDTTLILEMRPRG
jgi:colicin import membrane protein